MGIDRKVYHFHESILCEKSAWFRDLLALPEELLKQETDIEKAYKDSQDSQRKEIYRPDDDIDAFDQFFDWVYGHEIQSHDEKDFQSATHISEWLVLHSLANELCVEDLAIETLKLYRQSKDPLWSGVWMPLPSEVRYIYDHPNTTGPSRSMIINHVRSMLFSLSFPGNIREVAELLDKHKDFLVDVLYNIRKHVFLEHGGGAEVCGPASCAIHPQVYTDPLETVDIHLSDVLSVEEDAFVRNGVSIITPEEEEALEAAEILDAITEFEQARQEGASECWGSKPFVSLHRGC